MSDQISFRPGSWFGIVGEAALVLLPPTEKHRVAALWEAVDEGAGFDVVLDALISSGLRELPGFVLVGTAEGETKVVLRGPARAVFETDDDSVELDGAAAVTWTERSLSHVRRLHVVVEHGDDSSDPAHTADATDSTGAAATAGALRIESGLVRVSAVTSPAEEPDAAAGSAVSGAGSDTAGLTGADEPGPVAVAVVPVDADAMGDGESGAEDQPEAEADPEPYDALSPQMPLDEVEHLGTDHGNDTGGFDQSDADESDADESDADESDTEDDLDAGPPTEAFSPIGAWDAADPEVPEAPGGWAPVPPPAPAFGAPAPGFDVEQPAYGQHAAPGYDQPGSGYGQPEESAYGQPEQPEHHGQPEHYEQDYDQSPDDDYSANPVPGFGADHDGLTRSGSWDPSEFAREQPGLPGQQQPPAVTHPVAMLAFAHGETVPVDRAILIGRAPEARRFSSTDQPRLVTVPSPNQEISSTHLEVRPGTGADHGTAVVTDMGSTNGTLLVQPGFSPEELQPGVAVQLMPGAVIDLGDGMTIQVHNA